MRKFFFLSTTFFVREGDAGGAAGGATALANGAGAASAALASKMDGGGGQQTPPAGDGGDAPWYSTLPAELHPTIKAKGWADAGAAIESYVQLHKLFGEDRAGRTVAIPTDKSTPEEIAAFHTKLGVPDKAEGYEIKIAEGVDPTFSKMMAAAMKDAGIPKGAGEKLAAVYQQQEAAATTAFLAQSDADMRALQTEWGADFDAKLETAGRGAAALGLKDRALRDKLERAVGTKTLLTWAHMVGEMTSEHGGPRLGSDGSKSATFTLTKESAQAKVEALTKDSEFQSRLQSPNAKVRDKAMIEWEEAHKQRAAFG